MNSLCCLCARSNILLKLLRVKWHRPLLLLHSHSGSLLLLVVQLHLLLMAQAQ